MTGVLSSCAVLLLCFLLLVTNSLGDSEGGISVPQYQCSLCIAALNKHFEEKVSPHNGCVSLFEEKICDELSLPKNFHPSKDQTDSRDICYDLHKCTMSTADVAIANSNLTEVPPDVRITRALGKRGYDKIRVSVIANRTFEDPMFDYTEQFRHRWTDKYLSTGIVSVTPGEPTTLRVAGQEFNVYLPEQGHGVRGIIIADPCLTSEWLECKYENSLKVFERHTAFLNAAFSHPQDVNYWQILGDNFYDLKGHASSRWFGALSAQTKSNFFASTPGNHDFWIHALPELHTHDDQLGNGFMQFYGQDVMSSFRQKAPYDFRVNPNQGPNHLPPAGNFFFYNQIGNVAFIGFSGAHSWHSMESYFDEACTWAGHSKADVVLLLGHWHIAGNGAVEATSVPSVYNQLLNRASCKPIASKLRYFMGHKHCNMVTQPNVGFMVGSQGMSDTSMCFWQSYLQGGSETLSTIWSKAYHTFRSYYASSLSFAFPTSFSGMAQFWTRVSNEWDQHGGALGIPVVDTTNKRFRVLYFPLAQADRFDNSDKIISCVQERGVSGCYHLATVWADMPL